MKKWMTLALLLLISQHTRAQNVAIFNGAGTCKGCAEAIGAVFDPKRDKVVYLDEKTLDAHSLRGVSLYVQPGGSDDIDETLNALRPAQVQAIRDFVAHGGGYLGVCAGAYLAARYSSKKDNKQAYGLVALDELDSEITDPKPTLLPIQWGNKSRMAYYQSGPHMGKEAAPGVTVLARYQKTQHIAAQSSRYQQGTVVLIGPHLEADESWYQADKLSLKHGLNLDLFREALNRFPSIAAK